MKFSRKKLLSYAASVRGARSAGIETAASTEAVKMLSAVNRWLAMTVPALSEYDDQAWLINVDQIAAAAAELANAAGLEAFRFSGNDIISKGYAG